MLVLCIGPFVDTAGLPLPKTNCPGFSWEQHYPCAHERIPSPAGRLCAAKASKSQPERRHNSHWRAPSASALEPWSQDWKEYALWLKNKWKRRLKKTVFLFFFNHTEFWRCQIWDISGKNHTLPKKKEQKRWTKHEKPQVNIARNVQQQPAKTFPSWENILNVSQSPDEKVRQSLVWLVNSGFGGDHTKSEKQNFSFCLA